MALSGHIGKVYIVGAGPGGHDLLTLRAKDLLQETDLVLIDPMVDDRALIYVRAGAELISVGEIAGGALPTQMEINNLLIEHASQGKTVTYLKNGDPFVMGRGEEVVEALTKVSVPFEVVPGVSSAIAVPAYAGIPLTYPGVASSFTVVSGNEDPSTEEALIDWRALAQGVGTLIVLMGWESLPGIVDVLLTEGMDASTPVALIERGTEPRQRTVVSTVREIVLKGRQAGLRPPVVAIFGQVVALRDRMRWYDNQPLSGRRVVVTRSSAQAGELTDLLAREGADPLGLPCIEVHPLDDDSLLKEAAKNLGSYDWVVFTSTNAVEALWSVLERSGTDARAFGGVRVAAIGPATSKSLAVRGIIADYVPIHYVAEALLDGLTTHVRFGDRVLVPGAEGARGVLVEGIRSLGATVDALVAYHTRLPQGLGDCARRLFKEGGVDVVTFASSSAVRNLVAKLQGEVHLLDRTVLACIGTATAETVEELGLKVGVQAREHTLSGLVDAIKDYFARDLKAE